MAIESLLRGPAEHLLQDPSKITCRLCGHSLTGNIVADQLAVANYRLVGAMDLAWATAERFYHEKVDLQRQALAKQRDADTLRGLINELRAQYPSQVHAYVTRALSGPRERIARLQAELEELKDFENLGAAAEPPAQLVIASAPAPSAEATASGAVFDVDWGQFRENVELRISKSALALGAGLASPGDGLPAAAPAPAPQFPVAPQWHPVAMGGPGPGVPEPGGGAGAGLGSGDQADAVLQQLEALRIPGPQEGLRTQQGPPDRSAAGETAPLRDVAHSLFSPGPEPGAGALGPGGGETAGAYRASWLHGD